MIIIDEENYLYDVGDIIDNKFLHAKVVSRHTGESGGISYECECNKCGYIFNRTEKQVIKGIGCGACSGRTLVKGINDIPSTATWMINFFPGGKEQASEYTRSCSRKFTPICPDCGRISDVQTSPNRLERLHSIGCVCKDGVSIPNKIIRNLMEQAYDLNMISWFQKEYKEVDEKNTLRSFDMKFRRLDGKEYFVEMDGGRHGSIIRKHSNTKWCILPAKLFYADLMKDNIAKKLNIELIRIDCYKSDLQYIKDNIYESELSNIINLDDLDWEKIELECFSSTMLDVCKYKNEHKESFSTEVAEIFGISEGTVRNYWHRGAELGLCEYNPSRESDRWAKINKIWKNGIPVKITNIDTNQEWNFYSINDFTRHSEEILGTKFTKSMFEKRFAKTNEPFILFQNDLEGSIYKIEKIKESEVMISGF